MAMIYYKNLKMLGCLLLALLFAYLIDCTNFVANTAVALIPCHTAYFPALLCSSAVLLSLSTRPTVRFGLSDLKSLFSLFFSVLAHRLACLALFVSSYLYSQFTLKKEDRARSREAKEEREKRRKDLRLAQNFSMGLRSGE